MPVGHGLRPLCIPTLIINLGLLPTLPKRVRGKWGAEPWSCVRAQVTSLLWLLDLSKRAVLAPGCTESWQQCKTIVIMMTS